MSTKDKYTKEMEESAQSISRKLPGYARQFSTQPRRVYGGTFDDWPDGNTGCHEHPVVYGLWNNVDEINPVYIGQSIDLGKRLSDHFKGDYWSREIKYASFLEHEDFTNPSILSITEKFLFAVFKPTDNDPSK
jgi:hypothetical protein